MLTESVLHISLRPLPNNLILIIHVMWVGAMINVMWTQWGLGWQIMSLIGLGWGYRIVLRRYAWLTDRKSIQAVTFTTQHVILHLSHQVQIQCVLIPPAKLLPWTVLLNYQTPAQLTPKTLVLLRHSMDAQAWRRLKVRLLYSLV